MGNICKANNTRLFEICEYGEDNTQAHADDHCRNTISEWKRADYRSRLDRCFKEIGVETRKDLHEYVRFLLLRKRE